MSLLKTLKGQILVVSAACMVAALLVLTPVNYFSARAQARVALAEEGQATAKSHAEAIEEWTRAKAASSRPPSRPLKSLSPPNPWPCCVMRASSAPHTLAKQTKSTFSPKPQPPRRLPPHCAPLVQAGCPGWHVRGHAALHLGLRPETGGDLCDAGGCGLRTQGGGCRGRVHGIGCGQCRVHPVHAAKLCLSGVRGRQDHRPQRPGAHAQAHH